MILQISVIYILEYIWILGNRFILMKYVKNGFFIKFRTNILIYVDRNLFLRRFY